MTGSIGDYHFKDPVNILTNVPYTDEIDYSVLGSPLYLIVACDGVWDYMSHEDVIDFIKNSKQKWLITIMSQMFDTIIEKKGGSDNISCIIAKLN